MSTIQGTVTCAVQTEMLNCGNSENGQRILEVACGPGKHSLLLATSFLKPKGVLISCDFSEEMIKKLKKNYLESDYNQVPGNLFILEENKNYLETVDGLG